MGPGALVFRGVRVILVAGGIVVAVVLALKIAAILLEPRLAFLPVREYAASPEARGLPFENVFIRTEDGLRLHGWLIPAETGAAARAGPPGRRPATILFFHGNAENISGGLDLAVRSRAAGYDLLLIDYRGYGESAGRPSENGLYSDGRAALLYLRSRPGGRDSRVVVWGRSIGTAVAVAVAAGETGAGREFSAGGSPAGVILESPLTSVPDLLRAGGHWLLLGFSRFGNYRFDSAARIGRVRVPLLVIHGTDDEVVPFDLGRRLFDLAPGRKEMVAIEDGGHNDLWALHADEVWDAALEFLKTLEHEDATRGPGRGRPRGRAAL